MAEKIPEKIGMAEWQQERRDEDVKELCRFFSWQEFVDLYGLTDPKDISNKRKFNQAVIVNPTTQGFSVNQPAVLYYGTESEMQQEKGITEYESYGDLAARKKMEWKKGEIFEYYKRLIHKRAH